MKIKDFLKKTILELSYLSRDSFSHLIPVWVRNCVHNVLRIIALGTRHLARLDRVYKASEGGGKSSEIGKLSIERVVRGVILRTWNRGARWSNHTPTVCIIWNRMAMTMERYWANFRILRRVYSIGFKGRTYVPVILAISILYCYGEPYRCRV